MDGRSNEARMWQVLGLAFLAGGGLPLGLSAFQFVRTRLLEPETLQLGVWSSVIILIGFISLVWSRVHSAREGFQNESMDWIWTALIWVGIPAGAAIFDLEWRRAQISSLNQQATLLAGAFIFLTGLAALIGERAVHRIQCSAIRRTIDSAEQRRLAEASETSIH
jgi:hypothetical protein